MCAQRKKTAALRVSCAMVFATVVLASVSVDNSAASAAGLQRDADAHIAYIFVDPRLSEDKKKGNEAKISREAKLYRERGYEIRYREGTMENMLQAVLDPKVAAITFVGEGGSGSAKNPVEPTLGPCVPLSWRQHVELELMKKGYDIATASAMAQNFGLHRVANYSCYSYLDSTIAELFVRPGGEYWGTPLSYNSNPNPLSALASWAPWWWSDTDLTKYVVKKAQAESRRGPTNNYDAFVEAVGTKKAQTESRQASMARQWGAVSRAATKRYEEANQGRPELITKIE